MLELGRQSASVHNARFLVLGLRQRHSSQHSLWIHEPVRGACGRGMHAVGESTDYTAGPQTSARRTTF